MRRILAMLCLAVLLPCAGLADALPKYDYTWTGHRKVRSYHTQTLDYVVETTNLEGCMVYVTKVWMQDPARQIKKATSNWRQDLMLPETMAAMVPGCALAINGSGYVSPVFPEIPDVYPGSSPDYYYTPLGSLTITDGKIFRDLEGVPFYGITLEEDGLHLYNGVDNTQVLGGEPTQTWSFYELCPLIQDHQDILDRTWPFANKRAARTIIARMDACNYVILTATSSRGLTVCAAVDFLKATFDPEWAYDLDGGPSSALLCRNKGKKTIKAVYGGKSKDADIMAFVELTE